MFFLAFMISTPATSASIIFQSDAFVDFPAVGDLALFGCDVEKVFF